MKNNIKRCILDTIICIEASPKNRTDSLRDKMLGGIAMAQTLNAITPKEGETAYKYIQTAAAWRGVRNFAHMERWQDEYNKATAAFNETWGN